MKPKHFNPLSASIGDVVPYELKARKLWLLWREEPDEDKDKPKKVPYWANGRKRSGKQGSPADVANLVTFDEVLAAYNAASDYYAGIGVALLPGMGIGALDLDDCIDASGKPVSDVDVRRILKACKDCYTERSPSGLGLRVFGSTGGFRQIADKGFEAYSQGRFMTVTGEVLMNDGAWASVDGGVAAMRSVVQPEGVRTRGPVKNVDGKGVNLSTHAPDPETPENVERVRDALTLIVCAVSVPLRFSA
jgi:hypothetical protein